MADEFDNLQNDSLSHTADEPKMYSETIPAHAIFQLIVFTAIFMVGFFGNCIVIYGVLQQGPAKTTSSIFIANLALSDLAVLVLSLPVGLLQELASWPFGEVACKIFFPLGDVFLAVSIMTLTAIALDHSNFQQFWTILWPVWVWRYFGLIFTLILYTLIFENSGPFCG